MTRSQLHPTPEYFDRYILLCDDVELLVALQTSIDELEGFPVSKWQTLGDKTYAPGKWTVKDILQHLIDTERIFTYRALAFAREETQPLPAYDENVYATKAQGSKRGVESLIEELRAVHLSTLRLFESFTPSMLQKSGRGFKGEYSVASIGFCMPGHQRWHLRMLEKRYYPLMQEGT